VTTRPKTQLIAAARNDMPNESSSDASTRGAVTVSQKASQVSVNVLMNTADSGISTISARYSSV
jgi:hypothetical protein